MPKIMPDLAGCKPELALTLFLTITTLIQTLNPGVDFLFKLSLAN